MFPLREVRRSARVPIITRALVLLMVGVFVWQIVLSYRGGEGGFFAQWGARPRCILNPEACHISLHSLHDEPGITVRRWLAPLLSSAFLHAGAAHLAFNAWFLWVFGPAVEEKLGRPKYLLFYLACAVASAMAHITAVPGSPLPLVGASGAIAGVLGAHFVLLPRSWIVGFIPPLWIVPVPSLVFLLFWMAGQIAGARVLLPLSLGGVSGSAADAGASVAWAAHIGGFVFGALTAWRARSAIKQKELSSKELPAPSKTRGKARA